MKTIEKALDVLEIFLVHGTSLTVAEIAKLSGVNSSSICRICSLLASKDYLFQSTKRGPYSLGPKFLQFYDITSLTMKLKSQAVPFLNELSKKVNENILMAVPSGLEVLNIIVINPNKVIQAHAHEGERVPLFCSGAGKVILAEKTSEAIKQIYGTRGLQAYTENTITDLVKLFEELEKIKKEGVSINNEEYEHGLRSVAAPIRNGEGKVIAAISIVGSTITITKERIIALVPIVKDYALRISQSLGYK